MLKPCPRCNQDTESDDKFCGTCGFLLRPDSGLKADEVFSPKSEPKKVFSLEDDPTEAPAVETASSETKAKKLDLATKIKVKSKTQGKILKRLMQSIGSLIALILWLGLCGLSLGFGYLVFVTGDKTLNLTTVLSGLAFLIPGLYWLTLKNRGFSISLAHYPSLILLILSICSAQFLGQMVYEVIFWVAWVVFSHLIIHLMFSIRLFWFLRLAFMLAFLPAYLDLLWQISQKTPLSDLASLTHPVAQSMLPWLDQAASYLLPFWILAHILLPLVVFVCGISVFINLYQKEFYIANQRMMLALATIAMIITFHPVFSGFQFSVHRLLIQ